MERFEGVLLFALVIFVLALALWYAGVVWNRLAFKQFAVALCILPLIAFGFKLASPLFEPSDYRTTATGSIDRNGKTSAQALVPITTTDVEHQLELTPKIRGGNPPTEPIHLRYKLQSPDGEVVASGEQDLAPGNGLRWQSLTASFHPRQAGDHTLLLEFPEPAFSVDVRVREIHE